MPPGRLSRSSSRSNLHAARRQRLRCRLGGVCLVTLLLSALWASLPPLDWQPEAGFAAHRDVNAAQTAPAPILLSSPETAAGHYVQQAGGLPAAAGGKPPALVVRYQACGGLVNQHLCHIAGIAIAIALGADGVVMQQAQRRRKFAVQGTEWQNAPLSTVWDMGQLRAYAATKGLDIHEPPTLLPYWVADGYGAFNPYGMTRMQVVRFPYIAWELHGMGTFVKHARERVAAYIEHLTKGPSTARQKEMRWREVDGELVADLRQQRPHFAVLREKGASRHRKDSLLAKDPRIADSDWEEGCDVWELMGKFLVNQSFAEQWGYPLELPPDDVIPGIPMEPNLMDGWLPPVRTVGGEVMYHLHPLPERLLLLLPCPLYAVRALDSPLMTEVAMNLRFAPYLHDAAAMITDAMRFRSGKPLFNGLHLRLEADASAWIEQYGGANRLWRRYLEEVQRAGFNTSVPLYVASGIFSRVTPTHQKYLQQLRRSSASHLFDKTTFLDSGELHGMHSEARAALDFLVLAKSHGLVGFETSTYSILIQEYRILHGAGGRPLAMVDNPNLHEFSKEIDRLGAHFSTYPQLGAAAGSGALPAGAAV